MNATNAIIEYVKGERDWISAHTAACELANFGRIAPDAWPVQTVEQWREAIDGAVAAGMLQSDGKGKVWIPQEKAMPSSSKQLSLFGD